MADWSTLMAALQPIPALEGAACKGRAPLFDGERSVDQRAAAEICARCPVAVECLRWVSAAPSNSVTGIVAGRRFSFATHESLRPRPDGQVIQSTA